MTIVLNRKRRFTSHYDPTRMTTQRRAMQQRLQHKFAILKGRIIKLVVDEDAFGFKRKMLGNSTSARKESWLFPSNWDDLDWDQRNEITDRRMDVAVWGGVRNAFCSTGEGGGVDPSCSSTSSHVFARTADPQSAAYGGTKPESIKQLRSVYHQTSDEAAIKILEQGLLKTAKSVSPELAEEGYQDTKDGGEYVYIGLTKEASESAAVGEGTVFQFNLNPVRDRTVIQAEMEGGIALVHGDIKLSSIGIHAVHSKNKAVLQAWEKYKKLTANSLGTASFNVGSADEPRDDLGRWTKGDSSSSGSVAAKISSALKSIKDALTIPFKGVDRGGKRGPYMAHSLAHDISPETHDLVSSVLDRGISSEKQVDLSKLVALQTAVSKSTLRHLVTNPSASYANEPVIVVEAGGKSYLYDGTHRAEAALLSGRRTIRAKVYKLRGVKALNEDGSLQVGVFNTRFSFLPDPAKIKAFQRWLVDQFRDLFTNQQEDEAWYKYAEEGYKRGAGRAFDEVNKKKRLKAQGQGKLDIYQGTREDFLQSAFGRPESIDKIKVLAGRSFDDLKHITADMSVKMTRSLADSLVTGQGVQKAAEGLTKVVGIGLDRARLMAHTELSRAHSEGQLNTFKKLGVQQLGVMVEWSTSGRYCNTAEDRRLGGCVCKECEALEGIVVTVDEAQGMIPRHPGCMCSWIPANVGENQDGQKRGRAAIERAIKRSGNPKDWKSISSKRPTATVVPARNVFCPTGPGGGVNPHCGTGTATAVASITTGAALRQHLESNLHSGIGAVLTKVNLTKIEHLNPHGIVNGQVFVPKIFHSGGKVNDEKMKKMTEFLEKELPPGTSIKVKNVHVKKKSVSSTTSTVTTPTTPITAVVPAALPSTHVSVPYSIEHSWETGKPEPVPTQLNGVPFAPAPPKFWENTKDKDIKEPTPLKPIQRVGIMLEEPDGRVWIVQPTGQFGNRKYTLPGGHTEAGLSNQQNALKELWEETGLQAEITGHIGDFEDSNNGNNGRLYRAKRIGGAPWDAKIEQHIRHPITGQPAAESEKVTLVTKDRAAELLHRTDDQAQLAAVHPIKVDTRTNGNMLKKLVAGILPAAKEYERKKRSKSEQTGNTVLHVVQDLRGFNEKPTVVPKASMDALVAKGDHIELMRGIGSGSTRTAKELAEDFRTGDHFSGHGCFGSGTYCDSNKGHSNVAGRQYGAGGTVLRMALPKTAKIIKQSELERKVSGYPSTFNAYSGGHGADSCWPGVQAALAGYDAIEIDGQSRRHGSYGKGFYVILNRSILTVQKEDARGHVIR